MAKLRELSYEPQFCKVEDVVAKLVEVTAACAYWGAGRVKEWETLFDI